MTLKKLSDKEIKTLKGGGFFVEVGPVEWVVDYAEHLKDLTNRVYSLLTKKLSQHMTPTSVRPEIGVFGVSQARLPVQDQGMRKK